MIGVLWCAALAAGGFGLALAGLAMDSERLMALGGRGHRHRGGGMARASAHGRRADVRTAPLGHQSPLRCGKRIS